jgi:transposase
MARFDTQIQEISTPFEAAIGLLDTIPGVARPTAEMIVAEIGTDMSRVPSADHLAAWAGVAPGHHERAGKRTSGKTRQGHRFLRTV